MGFQFDAVKQIAFDDVWEEKDKERAEQQAVEDFEKEYKIPEMKNRQMIEMPEGMGFLRESAASSPRRSRTFSRVASYEQEIKDLDEDEDEEMGDEDMEGQEGDYEDQEGEYDEEEEQYGEEQFEAQSAEEETEEDD